MSLISLSDISLKFDAHIILDGANLNIAQGDRMALVGRNGCGKSTLLKIITGIIQPDCGLVERVRGVQTAYMPQDVPLDLKGSVYEVIASGLGEVGAKLCNYHRLLKIVESPHSPEVQAEFDATLHEIESIDAWVYERKISETIERMELDPALNVATISAGLKRRVLLGKGLVTNPDILILDEPTNHLDIDSVVWLEKFLRSCGKTLIFVSHDRTFLQNLADRVVEVDRGKLIAFDCDFKTFLKRRDDLLESQARNEEVFDKKLAQEEAWLRQGVKARRTRNEGRVRELMRLRDMRQQRRNRTGQVAMQVQDGNSSGQKVMDVKNLSVAYDGKDIIKDFSTTIYRGDKIGIIGRNGIGKTTLLNALLGRIQTDNGEVENGTKLEIAYFDQLRQELNPKMKPIDFIADGGDFVYVNNSKQNVAGYLQSFLFEPEQIHGEIGMLSGGERNRLLLAKLFSRPANVLVMDEPTNDLDMETIEILESALVTFPHTILLVSHDRTFLNNIVTGVFCFEEKGQITELVGGYDEWDSYRSRKKEQIKEVPYISKESQAKSKNDSPQAPRKDKFTNKERQELAELPDKIAALEEELSDLSSKMQDSEFVCSHVKEIASIEKRMREIQAEDERLMNRWTELEERQENMRKQ